MNSHYINTGCSFYKYKNNKLVISLFWVIISLLLSCASSDIFIRPGTVFSKYNRVAVFPFQDFFKAPGSGNQVADLFSFALLESGFDVIDRAQTETILREQGAYGQSGILDPATIPKVGKIMGVQAIITGSVSDYSTGVIYMKDGTAMGYSNVKMTIKMSDVETAQIVWAGSCEGSTPLLQGQLLMAAKKAIRNVVSKLHYKKMRSRQ